MRTQPRANLKRYAGLIALAMVIGLFAGAAPARAASYGLGEAGNYNVFVFNTFSSSNSDTEGRLAAGGSVSLFNYGLAFDLPNTFAGSSLVVGGSLSYYNGRVNAGNVEVGGAAAVGQSVSTSSGATVTSNVPNLSVSFASEQQKLTQLSQGLAAKTANAQATKPYSTINLSGDSSNSLWVFDLTAADLANASNWAFTSSIPSDVNIIFNISGTSASMTNQGQWALQSLSNRILFNFYEAETLYLSGIGVMGSILAPNADVEGYNGQMEGTLVAKSFKGTLEFHNNPYTAPADSSEGGEGGGASATPEPGTLLLFGPVLGGMYLWRRRQKHLAAQS